MIIFKFREFNESISGTELIGNIGPNYGDQKLAITLNSGDTTIIYSDITQGFYTMDDYYEIYLKYLKSGGKPLNGFNKNNLEYLLSLK